MKRAIQSVLLALFLTALTPLTQLIPQTNAAPLLTNPTPLVEYRAGGITSGGLTDGNSVMNATLYNSPSVTNGVATFNGVNQYAITNSNLSGSFSSLGTNAQRNLSIFAYIYPISANGTIVDELSSTTMDSGWHDTQMEIVGGVLKFRVWNCSILTSSVGISLNTWNYVGYVYDQSAQTMTAYVNGSQAGQLTGCSRLVPWVDGTSSPLYYGIGTNSTQTLGSGAYGNFKLAQFDIYNTPLTSSQVTSAYNTTKSTFNPLATPAAPLSSAITADSFLITDTAVASASSYLLYRYASDGTTLLESKTATTSAISTGTTFSGLTPNTTYVVKVGAVGDGINYSNSPIGPGTTVTTTSGATTISLALAGGGTTATYRQSASLIATVSVAGRVTFYFRGKRIPGCIKVASTAGSATCSWKPSFHGQIYLTAALTPTNNNYLSSSTTSALITIASRGSTR